MNNWGAPTLPQWRTWVRKPRTVMNSERDAVIFCCLVMAITPLRSHAHEIKVRPFFNYTGSHRHPGQDLAEPDGANSVK
jgi:hypothetical protein